MGGVAVVSLNSSPLSSSCPLILNPSPLLKLPKHKSLYPQPTSFSSVSSSSKSNVFCIDQCGKPQRRRFRIFNKIDSNPEDVDEEEDDEVQSVGVKAALSLLHFYKSEISPLLPKSCRYVPSCSEYSMIAYKKYGFVKGTVLTAWRICRCNPLGIFFFPSGIDWRSVFNVVQN